MLELDDAPPEWGAVMSGNRHDVVVANINNVFSVSDSSGRETPAGNLLALRTFKILVVGAGGLGCELLKDLALSGFASIDVIDMDTIDVSNLNRQFLFRSSDVGKSKAIVAANAIVERFPGVRVTPHFCKMQDKPSSFYASFGAIVAGLDSIEARRWLNAMVWGLVTVDEFGEPDVATIVPIIDGGSEGLKGHVRVIVPGLSACFECGIDLFPPPLTYQLCTIANRPRLPEHCVEYAIVIMWSKSHPDERLDGDNPEHLSWLFQQASRRAEEYSIGGVTPQLCLGVAKNIIPAVASTNAFVAAACATEALKIATDCAPNLDNYLMYNGKAGAYLLSLHENQRQGCGVCGSGKYARSVPGDMKLGVWLEGLKNLSGFGLQAPCLRSASGTSLYFSRPPMLEKATRSNLDLAMSELLSSGETVFVTDGDVLGKRSLSITVTLT